MHSSVIFTFVINFLYYLIYFTDDMTLQQVNNYRFLEIMNIFELKCREAISHSFNQSRLLQADPIVGQVITCIVGFKLFFICLFVFGLICMCVCFIVPIMYVIDSLCPNHLLCL